MLQLLLNHIAHHSFKDTATRLERISIYAVYSIPNIQVIGIWEIKALSDVIGTFIIIFDPMPPPPSSNVRRSISDPINWLAHS